MKKFWYVTKRGDIVLKESNSEPEEEVIGHGRISLPPNIQIDSEGSHCINWQFIKLVSSGKEYLLFNNPNKGLKKLGKGVECNIIKKGMIMSIQPVRDAIICKSMK